MTEPTTKDLPLEHYGLLLAAARSVPIADPATEPEDLVQATLLHLLEMPTPPPYNDEAHRASYARRAVVNRAINKNRTPRKFRASGDHEGHLARATYPDIANHAIARAALGPILEDAGRELRAALTVLAAMGWDHGELAAQLGVPRTTVSSACHRYRQPDRKTARNVRRGDA